jgi:hypothetical protein
MAEWPSRPTAMPVGIRMHAKKNNKKKEATAYASVLALAN